MLVRWGKGTRKWSQWTARQAKEVVELRLSAAEPPFPGFAHFSATIEDVLVLPEAWIGALSSVGGVYLLVCPRTGAQYVGSATGLGGFMARWAAYANDWHRVNRLLKASQRSNYAISILEVASPDMAPRDVVQREAAWKQKLGSRAHGLNANSGARWPAARGGESPRSVGEGRAVCRSAEAQKRRTAAAGATEALCDGVVVGRAPARGGQH